MSQNAINYLRENKDKYPREVLIEELRKTGYSEIDIADSVRDVYQNASNNPIMESTGANFWDFKFKKIYTTSTERWKDFLFGVLSFSLLGTILSLLFNGAILFSYFSVERIFRYLMIPWLELLDDLEEFSFIIIIAIIVLAVYLFKRRRFIFYGIISYPLLVIVMVVFYLMFFGFGM